VVLTKSEALEVKIKEKTSSVQLKDLADIVKQAQGPRDSAAASNSAVVISADKNVKYESVVKVMDTLQRAGIQRVGLSVQIAN
jgi:biopolymer transport protein TolR